MLSIFNRAVEALVRLYVTAAIDTLGIKLGILLVTLSLVLVLSACPGI